MLAIASEDPTGRAARLGAATSSSRERGNDRQQWKCDGSSASGGEFRAAKIIEEAGRCRPDMNDCTHLLISMAAARHEVIRLFVWDENDPRCQSNLVDELIPS